MKKIASAAILFSITFSACLPAFAQRTRLTSASPSASVQFDKVEAYSDGRGVLVQWQMVSETSNTGFYVFRVGAKGLERIGNRMVVGARTLTKDPAVYGEKYQQYDPQGTPSTVYVVQSLMMDGVRTLSDKTSARFVSSLSAVAGGTAEGFLTAAESTNGDLEMLGVPTPDAPQLSPDLATHRSVVAQPGVKIGIKTEGLYRVTRAELQAAGFNLASTSANWRLFMEGIEQSIIVGTNDQYIEFYGKGRDDVESDTRVYYLIADTTPGKRIGQSVMRPIGGVVASPNFLAATTKKERTIYDSQFKNGDAENYFGTNVDDNPNPLPITLNLPGADTTATANATVTLKLMGLSTGQHSTRLVINGHDLGPVNGNGQASYSGLKTVPASFFVDGPNSLQLTSSGPADQSYFDSVAVTYARKYKADQNTLKFNGPGRKTATLSDFSSPNIRVFDTSVEGQPVEVTSLQGVQNGCGYGLKIPSYRGKTLVAQGATPDPRTAASASWNIDTDEVTLTGHQFFTGMKGRVTTTGTLPGGVAAAPDYYVRVTGCNTVTLFDTKANATNLTSTAGKINITSSGSGDHTITPSSVLQAASVTQNTPSTLSTVNHNANMVIISYSAPDFMAAANTWANYRRGQGFTVEVVDVADIYDEFSYGSLSSASIKDFLSFTRSWSTPPQYALLIGDATYDPRNYEGFGDFDLVPTKRFDSFFTGETVSDDALADFNNDGLADMAVGRIPARTASDITTIFNKTTAFETPAQQSFSRGGAFASDLPSGGFDFSASCQTIRNELPPSMSVDMIDRGAPGSSTTLINSLNTGKYIVNYCGHGTTGLWATASFFSVSMVPQLTNTTNQSIFTMLTCLNGYFVRLNADSLSEALIKSSNGGAVAAWGSTGDTTPDIQQIMAQRFYAQVSSGTIKRIGDLIRDAKAAVPFDPNDNDVRYSWELLGDPMLKVRQ